MPSVRDRMTPLVLGGGAHGFLDMRPWDAGRGLFQNG